MMMRAVLWLPSNGCFCCVASVVWVVHEELLRQVPMTMGFQVLPEAGGM